MSQPIRHVRRPARRWWPLAVAVPLGVVAGAGYAVLSPPVYSASSYVVVVPDNAGESGVAVNFAQAYGRLAGQPQVLAAATADAGRSTAELETLVHGTTSPDAPVIEIDGSGGRPQDAVQAADAVARALVAFANTSSKATGVRLVPLAAAAEPDVPSTPSGQLDVAVGAASGVLIGALGMMTRRRSTGPEPSAAVPTPSTEPVPAPAGGAAGPASRPAQQRAAARAGGAA